jgi:L-lactate utilization protein LutC
VAVLRESDILPDMAVAFDRLDEVFTAGETRCSLPARRAPCSRPGQA